MFRHPCILKYVEGNESDTGVFYVSIKDVVRVLLIGNRISNSFMGMVRIC